MTAPSTAAEPTGEAMVAAIVARRRRMTSALRRSLLHRNASSSDLMREAFHARALCLAAALRGVSLADVYYPCPPRDRGVDA